MSSNNLKHGHIALQEQVHIAQPLPVLASTGLLMTMVLVRLIQVQIAVKTNLNGHTQYQEE
jgi:hypothetical protein